MGITHYRKEVAPGEVKTFYLVVAEAINKFSGLRVQKKRRGIPSKPKAQHVYKELWNMCREERPDGASVKNWGELLSKYQTSLAASIRSSENLNGFSPQVVRTKNSRLVHLMVWSEMHLDLITPQFVTEQFDKMEKDGASRSLTNHLLKEVKCIFSYAIRLGTLKANPFAGLKERKMPKKRKEALTHQEANKLLSEAKRRNHPYYHIWLLTIALGLRRSELAGLKWLDVDFDQRLIYLRRQLIPREGLVSILKDREERVVAIPKHVIPVLKEMKLSTKNDFVIRVQCQHWAGGQQAQVLREFCRQIGIKEVTHHQLRATHITLALVDGIPLGIVKENVGHAKLSTTDLYFRSAGINMKGQTDGLRIEIPSDEVAEVISMRNRG
jgi:integrase